MFVDASPIKAVEQAIELWVFWEASMLMGHHGD